MRVRQEFPNSLQSIGKARHYAADTLRDLPSSLVESAILIVSELATNSLRHAQTGFALVIDLDDAQLQIAVTDFGAGEPAMQSPGPTDHSGRGLRIVELLAADWGITPSTPLEGKTVWFRLTIEDRRREDAR
jgi:anti-sigma regulatory factor (Ser/Thr protein kinase)